MHTTDSQTTHYGWIPTNLGELQFGFISTHDNTTTFPIWTSPLLSSDGVQTIEVDPSNLTDTLEKKYRLSCQEDEEEEELLPKNVIVNIKNNTTSFDGTIELIYDDAKASASFRIQLNGKVEFSNYLLESKKVLGVQWDTKAKVFFIFLKSIIHGDNHHHQKIDTALILTQGNFDANQILRNLLIHTKTIERNIKRLNGCSAKIEAILSYHELEGFVSYSKSFYTIFKNEIGDDVKILYDNLDNVKSSAKAKVDRFERDSLIKKNVLTTLVTLSALFVSISILNKGVSFLSYNATIAYFLIPVALFVIIEWCTIVFILKKIRHPQYELVKYLRYYPYKKLCWRGKLNKVMVDGIPWILMGASLLYLINVFG